MNILGLIINLIGGGLGGLVSGSALKEKSLGAIGNILAGAIGGTVGAYILQAIGFLQMIGVADMPIGTLATEGVSSAVIGGIVTAIIGMIKNKAAK